MTPGHAKAQLLQLRAWAKERIGSGVEPPWAWYQYMKLIETADAIIGGLDATTTAPATLERSPQSEEHPGNVLRLAADSSQPGSSLRRSKATAVVMPM